MTEVWSPRLPAVMSSKLSYLWFKPDKICRTSKLKCSSSIPRCRAEQRSRIAIETQWLSTGSSCVQKGYRVPRFRERSQEATTLQNAKIPAKKKKQKQKHTSCLLTADWKLNMKISGLPHLSYTVVDSENSQNKRRPVLFVLLSVLEEYLTTDVKPIARGRWIRLRDVWPADERAASANTTWQAALKNKPLGSISSLWKLWNPG